MSLPVPADALVELTDLRDAHTKVYSHVAGGGRRIALVSQNQHFRHVLDNHWADEEDELISEPVAGTFETNAADIQFQASSTGIKFTKGAVTVVFQPSAVGLYDTASHLRQQIAVATFGTPTRIANNAFQWDNVFPNVDLQVAYRPHAFKERFIVRQRPNLPDPASLGMDPATTYLYIAFAVTGLPRVPVEVGTGTPFSNGYVGTADLVLNDAQGNPLVYFPAGTVTSARKRTRVLTRFRTAQIPFGLAVQYSQVQIATYPLIVDPTTSVYPAASGDDGYLSDNNRNGSADVVDTAGTSTLVGNEHFDDGKGTVYEIEDRSYFLFDLASLSGATCNSSSLNLYIQAKQGNIGTVTPKLYTTSWGPTLTTADWGQAGTDQGTLTDPATGAYRTWTMTAANIEAKFGGVASFELRSSATTGANYANILSYDNASNKPYLYVDYTSGGGSTAVPVFYHQLQQQGIA